MWLACVSPASTESISQRKGRRTSACAAPRAEENIEKRSCVYRRLVSLSLPLLRSSSPPPELLLQQSLLDYSRSAPPYAQTCATKMFIVNIKIVCVPKAATFFAFLSSLSLSLPRFSSLFSFASGTGAQASECKTFHTLFQRSDSPIPTTENGRKIAVASRLTEFASEAKTDGERGGKASHEILLPFSCILKSKSSALARESRAHRDTRARTHHHLLALPSLGHSLHNSLQNECVYSPLAVRCIRSDRKTANANFARSER